MPHHCLQVYDILDLIFSFACEVRSKESRKDLLSLALTCQDFKEVALDVLWHTQTNLIPLLMTIPGCIGVSTGRDPGSYELILEKYPNAEGFSRLLTYSRRVRKITYFPNALFSPEGSDLSIVGALWSYHQTQPGSESQILLPNLTRVEFSRVEHAIDCLDYVLESKSVSLSFYWADPSKLIVKTFSTIQQHASNMQELDLGTLRDYSERAECASLSDLVCAMTDLRRLSCAERVLTAPAIRYLASLPKLRALQIPNTSKSIMSALCPENPTHPSAHNQQYFAELEELTMYEDDLTEFARLAALVKFQQLRRLAVHWVHTDAVPSQASLRVALRGALRHCTDMREIRLKRAHGRAPPAPFHAPPPPPRKLNLSQSEPGSLLEGFVLEAALSFKFLTVFQLDLDYQYEWGDALLTAMADAWPDLRYLQIGPFFPKTKRTPSTITYQGILHLLRKCRKLEGLVFSFDGTSMIPPIDGIPEECVNKNITSLAVGYTIYDSSDTVPGRPSRYRMVADFLKHVFPRLEIIESSGDWATWDCVVKSLRDF
ncbi:hypothetical protein D9613_010173 [Agrocybe pediades]|uniref:F-box domain-containing protein n=1 Tax=Agrocybe pediades TaxID=84607 RepID=A0A8H4QY58_9AGAR|nr:hypothetical protein D9613_010173 [Agrocybe pediades]